MQRVTKIQKIKAAIQRVEMGRGREDETTHTASPNKQTSNLASHPKRIIDTREKREEMIGKK